MADLGIVKYFGSGNGRHCGYCDSESGFVAHWMWADKLTVQNLQDLTDRGWRRGGQYCYKPIMDKMCCPLYIIRCDAPRFEISKSQKKVIKRLHKYLLMGENRVGASIAPAENPSVASPSNVATTSQTGSTPTKTLPRPGVGPDPNKPPCRKAKEVRREKRKLKQQQQQEMKRQAQNTSAIELPASGRVDSDQTTRGEVAGTVADTPPASKSLLGSLRGESQCQKKTLEELLVLPSSGTPLCHKLEIRLVRSHPRSPEFDERYKESYDLYRKYQIAVHKDPPSKCSEENFSRFLLDSPLLPESGPKEWECGYGSYHQWYILDGKLIMVGVLDILPKCLSSKYVFYDPDYNFLTLGVFSALTEMALVRKLHACNPTFQYYCMGYYVHDCQKMVYKGSYSPSFLLCPETYHYVPIEQCRPKLDVSKYSRLYDKKEEEEVETDESAEAYLNSLVLFQDEAMPYRVLCIFHGSRSRSKVKEYSSLVGPAVASQCRLFLQ